MRLEGVGDEAGVKLMMRNRRIRRRRKERGA